MVGIQGVGGVPEPPAGRPANVRDRKTDKADEGASTPQDGVKISSEAQEAASTAQLVQLANQEPDIRADRVVEAKEAIERGDYRLPNVIAEVARRLSELL